jgi:hypothetical protein
MSKYPGPPPTNTHPTQNTMFHGQQRLGWSASIKTYKYNKYPAGAGTLAWNGRATLAPRKGHNAGGGGVLETSARRTQNRRINAPMVPGDDGDQWQGDPKHHGQRRTQCKHRHNKP